MTHEECKTSDQNKECPVNAEFVHTKNVLNKKQQVKNIYSDYYKRVNKRYVVQLNQETEKKNTDKIYQLGKSFTYGYEGENVGEIKVEPKYSSFKQELTQNKIEIISNEQFNQQLKNAELHFNSDYCKQYYWCKKDKFGFSGNMLVEYVLALMIYCNFDCLQYEFSKTYRSEFEDGEDHRNFYCLGKYLKISVHHFGTSIKCGSIKVFYHGVNQQLFFSQYIGRYTMNGLSILCPLSTTSCIEVAANFSNNNSGLIIEFGDVFGLTNYFSVGWLSDFSSEREFLFLQNYDYLNHGLEINNIIDTVSGCEYSLILNAIKSIHDLIRGGKCMIYHIRSSQLKGLIRKILEHQLSGKTKWNDQSSYVINLIN
eukprot:182316_1